MTSTKRYIVGLGGSNHDFSAVLAEDWNILVGIEQERISRRKHGKSFWFQNPIEQCLDYCLNSAGLHINDISEIVSSDLLPGRALNYDENHKVRLFPHHLCHAASAYLMVKPDVDAVILVADGMGSITSHGSMYGKPNRRETISFYHAKKGQLKRLGGVQGNSFYEHDGFPNGCSNSIGKFYEIATKSIGFDSMQEGKTMGLAAFGTPRFASMFRDHIQLGNSFETCFKFDPINSGFAAQLEELLTKEANSFVCRADIAASTQLIFEEVLLHAQSLLLNIKADVFMFSGGCALNTVANTLLSSALNKQKEFIAPPHASDAGIGLGALWLAQCEYHGTPAEVLVRGKTAKKYISRLGKTYSSQQVREAIGTYYPKIAIDEGHSSPVGIANILAGGAIIGFFEGRSEFGPRALGGRSLLADPRAAKTRERINREIKHREPFRPLAPIISGDLFDEFFEPSDAADRFMLRVAKAKPHTALIAPSIVHSDMTARVQCIYEDSSPFLHSVLMAFYEKTGVPVLINTSFNRRGEPIVETPVDAIDAFIGLNLEYLIIDGKVYFSA